MRSSLNICLYERTVDPYSDAVVVLFDINANFLKLLCNGLKMLWNDVLDDSVTFCSGDSDHKSTGFDLIRNNRISSTVEVFNSTNLNNVCTCTHDVCTHRVEEISEVNDMRFFSRIFDDSKSLSFNSCEHSIHGSTDSYNVKEYLITSELISSEIDHSLTEIIICTESCKSFKVLIYRTVSERTSARH